MDESNNLTTKLVEIRLSINHLNNENKVFILLEGKTDIKLFRNIFSNDYTDTSKLDGKDNLVEALQTLQDEGFTQILGIKDADFEHLENISNIENLFITDYHDMEIEMIESKALKSVIDEYSSESCYKLHLSDLKNNIYEIALEIGYIRWYNEKFRLSNGKGLFDFKRVKLNFFISLNSCIISFSKEDYFLKLQEQLTDSEVNIQEEIDKLKMISIDKLQICNGHDLTLAISKYFSQSNINQDRIESALRLSYTFNEFEKTNLFTQLNLWAETHNYRLFNEI